MVYWTIPPEVSLIHLSYSKLEQNILLGGEPSQILPLRILIEGKSEVATTRTRIRVLDSIGTVCKDSGWISPTSFNPDVVRSEVYWFNFSHKDLIDASVGPFHVESYHSYKSKKTNQWYTFKVNHNEALNGKIVA